MNKKITGILSICMLLLVSLAVNAQVPTPPAPSATTMTIGSSSQERSNPLDEDGAQVVIGSRTLTFNNIPTVATWKAVITSQVAEPKYTLTTTRLSSAEQVKSELRANAGLLIIETDEDLLVGGAPSPVDQVITIKGLIPANLDAIDSNFNTAAFKVATLRFQLVNASALPTPTPPQTPEIQCNLLGGALNPTNRNCEIQAGSVDVLMQAENILEINNIKVEVNSRERKTIDDEDTVKSRKPGDVLDFDVEVENKAQDDSNIDVRNADIDFNCDSNDINIDDENIDLGDVNAGDSETEALNANLEDDAEDGNIACDISSNGLDRNGAKHGQRIDFDVEIDRKNHDIQIRTININPAALTCEDTSFQMIVNMLNLGTSDEDEVALEVTSKPLGISQRLISNLELNEDDADSVSATIAVDPKKLKQGTYAMQVQSFYDNVKLSNTEIAQIENTCGEASGTTTPGPVTPEPPQPANLLSLDQTEFKGARTATVSIPVRVTNTESTSAEYVLMIDNVNEFGEQASTKTVFLNPGQSSTVFLNVKVKEGIQDGKYSATVKLLRGDEVIEASEFVVDVSGGAAAPKANSGLNLGLGGEGTTRVFWIIGDIVLVVIAIFFIRLIFTSGEKKKVKKMADLEPEQKKRR